MKKTILITGWLGYIGSHAVVEFEQFWYKTVIVDNLCNSSIDILGNINKILWYKPDFYEVDLRDKDNLEEVFSKYIFDWIIHFAWLKSPNSSIKNSFLYYDNNINWSLNLFELMNKYNSKKIIFSSSAAIYSCNNISPVNESWELWTIHPYWTTKYILELILKDMALINKFSIIALRYFNPIWAHKSWFIWENPEWVPNNLLPYIIDVWLGIRDKLYVYWNDYPTSDWTWIRDYIHVIDLVRAHIKAFEKLELFNDWNFEAVNVWTGKGTSVLEMINFTQNIIWKQIPYKITDRRLWDLPEVYADVRLAEDFLWWKSQYSIEDWILDSWNFNCKSFIN